MLLANSDLIPRNEFNSSNFDFAKHGVATSDWNCIEDESDTDTEKNEDVQPTREGVVLKQDNNDLFCRKSIL